MKGSTNRARRTLGLCCSAVAWCVVFINPASGQENQISTHAGAVVSQQTNTPPDEIVVTGRTRQDLFNTIGLETENFYTLLNQVLDNEDYRIVCKSERWVGSRIPRRVCRTRFQERIEGTLASTVMLNLQIASMTGATPSEITVSTYDPAAQLLAAKLQFQKAVLKAVNSNAKLNRSVHRLMALKKAYEDYQSPRQKLRQKKRSKHDADE